MVSGWKWRAFRLAERPIEVSLVTASCFAEIAAGAENEKQKPRRLSREEALGLFDGRGRDTTFALRAFLRDNGLGPSLILVGDGQLVSYVRQEIAVGALVAIHPVEERKRIIRAALRPTPAPAPVPIRRGPPAPAAPEPVAAESPEFLCPGVQAKALAAAAESGAPFCVVCQCAAAARAMGLSP